MNTNPPAAPLQLRETLRWRSLINALAASSDAEVLDAFGSIIGDLESWGIPGELVQAIEKGLRQGAWNEAAEHFCRLRGLPVNFYLGPIRATDGGRLERGVLVLTGTPCGDRIVRLVDGLADVLGRKTFGVPCNFTDRHLEFYDVAMAGGPFDDGSGRFVALFVPDFLGGTVDPAYHALIRRSILLHNVFRARFSGVTAPVSGLHLRLNGAPAAFANASDADLDEALALWLSLHEMIHTSGPLPLFRARVKKLPLGLRYAGIEEMRVDMTAWMMLQNFQNVLPPIAPIARDMIMADRLLRSTRNGIAAEGAHGLIERDSDAENGALWIASLIQAGAINRVDDSTIDIDMTQAADAIRRMLEHVYEYESDVAEHPAAGSDALVNHAESLRRHYFGERTNGRFTIPAAARDLFAAWPPNPLLVPGAVPR